MTPFATSRSLEDTYLAALTACESYTRDQLDLVIASCRADAAATTCAATQARIAIWRGVAVVLREQIAEPCTIVASAEDMIKKSLEQG